MKLSPGKLRGLQRLADPNGRFKMIAADQRPPIKSLVAERRGVPDAPYADVADVKRLIIEELAGEASAVLLDPHYGFPAAYDLVAPRQGLILTLEDSDFDETPTGRRSSSIDDWSVEKIKRTGADAVKVLAWYRPDVDPAVAEHQQQYVETIGTECRRFDIPFVFELLVYAFPGSTTHTGDYVEQLDKRADHVIESVATFAHPRFGVDLFKLESPIPASEVPEHGTAESAHAADMFERLNSAAQRPWVMLSAGASQSEFRRIIGYAYDAGASGYLAGRAIWWQAFQQFPEWALFRSDLRLGGAQYVDDLNDLTDERAMPWTRHPTYGGSGPTMDRAEATFRHRYPGFEPS